MTRHIPMSEFKDHASEWVAAAERGEEIVITRHGKPVAALRSALPDAERQARAKLATARLLERRNAMRAAGMTASTDEIIAWKNEGRP